MKKIIIIICTLIGILLVTNPSLKAFEEYSKDYNVSTSQIEYYHQNVRKKLFNGFIFSTFQIQTFELRQNVDWSIQPICTHKFVGFCGNFIELKN